MKKTLPDPNPYRYLEAPPEIIVQLKAFQACGTTDPAAITAFVQSLDRAAFESAQEVWEARPPVRGQAYRTMTSSALAFLIAGCGVVFALDCLGASLMAWMLNWTFACMALAVLRVECEEKRRDRWRGDYFARLDRLTRPKS